MSEESNTEQQSVGESLGLEQQNQEVEQETSQNQGEVQSETTEELQEEIQDAIDQGATQEEVQDMIKEFELKVNGKTFTRKIDLSDEKAVRAEMQKALAGQMAMQESAEFKRNLENQVINWKQDPSKVFEDLGMNVEEFLNSYMESKIEESKKTPEQLERENLQRELEDARRREKELSEKFKREEQDKIDREVADALQSEIITAIDSHNSLTASPRVVQKIADTMSWAINKGHSDVTAEDVLPTVVRELEKEMQDMFEALPLNAIEKFVGKKTFDRFRKERLDKKKAPTLNEIKKEISVTAPKEEKKRAKKRLDDFMRRR